MAKWSLKGAALLCVVSATVTSTAVAEPIDIGSRRELFLDDYLIDSTKGVELKLHEPVRRDVVLKFDKPWEGCGCNYFTVFSDGEKHRMYYHGWQIPLKDSPYPQHPLVICYAESRDGITWFRPHLDLFEFQGSRDNNIVLPDIKGTECHDFSPFIDTNPAATPDARYKAIGVAYGIEPVGLWAFQSPDAIHWTPMQDAAVFTQGVFDTQNIAFWSEAERKYVLYYRVFVDGVRHVERAVSEDFLHWTREGLLDFGDGGPTAGEQFYVNQIKPYYRAPHIYIGFPARYVDHGLTASTYQLPEPELRRQRVATSQRYGTAVTDTILITSRDGRNFRRSENAFLRPGLRTRYNWSYGDNYVAWHVIETPATEDDMPRELSLFATEAYFTEDYSRLRRYTLRIDGFVSAHADREQGELVTKVFTFRGKRLAVNFGTSAAGTVRIELQDADGRAIPGFTETEADLLYGDSLDRIASWKGSDDVSTLSGIPIRMRLVMKEADVYSWKFEL